MIPGIELSLACAFVALFPIVFFVYLVRRFFRFRAIVKKKAQSTEVTCKRCGYILAGQTLPRCPECGTLIGFDVPMPQMGIDEEEIRLFRDLKSK
jgi:uncharacterized paraquat-inducible protein A